jgi:malate dehydrogenase (oxaloacetate-decarboxylating)(NADP+)
LANHPAFSYRDANYDTANPSYIRKYLRTYGLTPPRSESYETQKARCLAQLGLKSTDIDKFQYLSTLRKNNVHLFYRLVTDHLRVCHKSNQSHAIGRRENKIDG